MKNRNNNILKHKTLSRLPQEGGFYSGVCPGAAAITILSSLFSSLWGTLGRKAVSHSLFLIPYSLFSSFGNNEHRIYQSATEGLMHLLAANPDGAASSVRVGMPEKPRTVSIEENNIPALCTFGFHWNSSATNVIGATHLLHRADFATTDQTAAAPRNICRTASLPFKRKVQRTEILKGNKEHRISLPGLLTGNVESGRKIPVHPYSIPKGLHVYRNTVSRGNSTPAGVAQSDASWYFYKHLIPLESGSRKHGLNAVRSIDAVPDFTGTGRLPDGATGADLSASAGWRTDNVKKGNVKYSIANIQYPIFNTQYSITSKGVLTDNIQHKWNIPVRCTSGLYRITSATNIFGALHLVKPQLFVSDEQTAAAPQNICSIEYRPSGLKVHSTEILKGNNEPPVSLSAVAGIVNLLAATPDGASSPVRGGSHTLNAVPDFTGTGRFRNESAEADLSACTAPVYPFGDNVNVTGMFPTITALTSQRLCPPRMKGDESRPIVVVTEGVGSHTERSILNAVRSIDADRFTGVATNCDLSACTAPDNVTEKVTATDSDFKMKKADHSVQQNAVRSIDADRLEEVATAADLSASAGWRTDNVKKENKEHRISLSAVAGNVKSGNWKHEARRKIPVQVISIPEGLHVYRKTANSENSTPFGVAQSNSSWYFYTHLIPLESGSRKHGLNAVRSTDAVPDFTGTGRLPDGATAADSDLSACTAPVYPFGDNVKKGNVKYSIANVQYPIANIKRGNNEHQISLHGPLAGNVKSGNWKHEARRKIPVQVISIPEGLHVYRKTANSENSTPFGVAQSNSSWYFYTHLIPLESGSRKHGLNAVRSTDAVPDFTGTGRLPDESAGADLSVPIVPIAIGIGTRPVYPFGDNVKKGNVKYSISNVQYPIANIKRGNNEHQISLPGPLTGNVKSGSWKLEVRSWKPEAQSSKLIIYNQRSSLSPLLWRGRERLLKYNQCSLLSPPLWGGWEGLLVSLLPRGSAGSGDCPGAAAITTIISFLFSSPWGASGWESEFPTPTSPNAGVGPEKGSLCENSGSRRAVRPAHSLPVINQFLLLPSGFIPTEEAGRGSKKKGGM